MSDLAYAFDWQEQMQERHRWKPSFEEWLIPVLITPLAPEDGFGGLDDLTEKWTKVEVTIFINGVEVGAKAMFDSLRSNYDHAVGQAAKELVDDIGFDTLSDSIREAERAATRILRNRLREAGVPLDADEEDR